MSRGRILVAIDVGTTKVCTMVGMEGPTGNLQVLGVGLQPSQGLRKGAVVNVPETRLAVRASVEEAERQAGIRITSVFAGVTGSHIACENTQTAWEGTLGKGPISKRDLEQAIRATSRVEVAPTRELLHVIPRSYVLDGLGGVRNPLGMHALRLDVETHVITGSIGPVENLVRAVEGAGVKVRGLALEPLASAEAVLSAEEREMGVVLVDIGGGTSDLAIFRQGAIWHTSVIPVGGYQFTNDLSVVLGIPYEEAEHLKVTYGHALPDEVNEGETLRCTALGGQSQEVSRREVSQILADRCGELVHLVLHRVGEAGLDALPPGGIVLTGGSAILPGLEALARQIARGRLRVGAPAHLDGARDTLEHPKYAAGVGILLWGLRLMPELRRRRNGHRNGHHNGHHNGTFATRLRHLLLGMVGR